MYEVCVYVFCFLLSVCWYCVGGLIEISDVGGLGWGYVF